MPIINNHSKDNRLGVSTDTIQLIIFYLSLTDIKEKLSCKFVPKDRGGNNNKLFCFFVGLSLTIYSFYYPSCILRNNKLTVHLNNRIIANLRNQLKVVKFGKIKWMCFLLVKNLTKDGTVGVTDCKKLVMLKITQSATLNDSPHYRMKLINSY